jgi:hypothetical protein
MFQQFHAPRVQKVCLGMLKASLGRLCLQQNKGNLVGLEEPGHEETRGTATDNDNRIVVVVVLMDGVVGR